MAFKYTLKNGGKTMEVDDPIYGKIEINSPFTEIILTKEMQRLNGISQNGFSAYEYPGLKNNERLSHSVGAFYVMSQIVEHLENELERYDIHISKDDKDMALCSMLLHDIGHGPFSHTFEKITNYSHEKRTTDILLGDTEVNKLLTSIYGKTKVKRIASYIAEIAEYEDEEKNETKSSFTKLLKSLISHQLDADRLDYLVRDSYHAELPTAINYKYLIKSMGVSVNSDQEYELLVDRKGLSNIETVLIERFQKYRDVYHSRVDGFMEQIFLKILERYKEVPESVDAELPELFKKIALDPENIPLNDFINMNDKQFLDAFDIIKENSNDSILKYLSNMEQAYTDYLDLNNTVDSKLLKKKLDNIFTENDLSNTFSILSVHSKIKLYKKEESLKINYGNVYKDLSEAAPNLIRPEDILEKNEIAFNPEILRIELGMNEKEFEPYRCKIKTMITELNKKPEEFELKYIIDKNQDISSEKILDILSKNGFEIINTKEKENDDRYYDTKDLSLLESGGSLRIRTLTQDGRKRYKATYKMPTSVGEVYSSRKEIEIELEKNILFELKKKMKPIISDVNFDDIMPFSLLNAITKRKDIVLQKNGVQVCLSFDNTKYINDLYYGNEHGKFISEVYMIEIEALGDVGDRVILNEINDILQKNFKGLENNKQSKYERGIRKIRSIIKIKDRSKENNSDLEK